MILLTLEWLKLYYSPKKNHQRSAQKNGKLGARRQSRLEGLGLSWEFVVAEGAWRLGHDELQRICGRFKAAAFGSSLEVFFQRHCRKGENTLEAGTPASFDVLTNEIRGLALNMQLEKRR